jgi:hypothetical protein
MAQNFMKCSLARLASFALATVFFSCPTHGAGLIATVEKPLPPEVDVYKMGESRRPDGATLTLDSDSLLLNGRPWTPVMGEFHFTRLPANEWREELLKMKPAALILSRPTSFGFITRKWKGSSIGLSAGTCAASSSFAAKSA